MDPFRQAGNASLDAHWWDGGEEVQVGEAFKARKLEGQIDRMTRRQTGRRTRTETNRKRGRYIKSAPARENETDIALDATLRAAAPFQKSRAEQRQKVAFAIQPSDLKRKVRAKKASNLILFVVDASWSMAVAERMSATKGAILSLLTDAYQRRDRVGLIVFQKDRAQTILPPTNSVVLARKALADIPVGGKTPLSAGLELALETFHHDQVTHPDTLPLMILLTDGAGNVSKTNLPPQEEAHMIAEKFIAAQIRSVVINMENLAFDQGLASKLARHLDAPCYSLAELRAENLYHTVRKEMES